MFTKITIESNALRTENFLRPYKRGEKEFTPEVAREVLTMTNHPRNIKDTLQLIANQPNQAQYKDIILSVFDHREQSNENVVLGKKLATANGFEDELNTILNHDYIDDTQNSVVYASASNQVAVYIATDEEPDFSKYPENSSVICTNNMIYLLETDLSRVKSLKFREESNVSLDSCTNPPAELDLSMCCDVNIRNTNLSAVKSLKLREKSSITLHKCTNLPAELDISMCSHVYLYETDLSRVKSLKFREKSNIALNKCTNLPAELDVSKCSYVYLSEADLSAVKSLKFREESLVSLSQCTNLPAELDLTMCPRVSLSETDLSPVKSLKFQKWSEVWLSKCINLPEELDLSMCKEVHLSDVDLTPVKSLKFRNKRKQEESKVQIPENWQGKIIYTDDIWMMKKRKSLFHG